MKTSIIISLIVAGIISLHIQTSEGQTSSGDKILVSITDNHLVYLSSQDKMVRANVTIPDYNPHDGDLIMKIMKESSGQIMSESKIYVKQKSQNIWSTEIGFMLETQNLNDSSLLGSYKINVKPENGAYEGSATFLVLQKPIPGPKIQSIIADDPTGHNVS